MGNCIHGMSHESDEKVRVVSLNGSEKEFKASGRYHGYKSVQHSKPFSPLPRDSKLEPGGICHLVPDVPKAPCKLSISIEKAKRDVCKTGKLKIMITKQQLELLLRNAKKLPSGKFAVSISESFDQD